MAKDFKDIRKEAEKQGFTVELTRGSHWKFIPPDETLPIVHAAGTPSDRRALDNLIGRLRKSGLAWPPRRRG